MPALKKAENGASIVLFSSVAVARGFTFHASIGMAQGAVEGLTRSLAADLAGQGLGIDGGRSTLQA